MDERARRRVVLFALERERRPAGEDDVELVVSVLLAVLLDDALPRFNRGVGVGAERADAEVPPDGPPRQALLAGGVSVGSAAAFGLIVGAFVGATFLAFFYRLPRLILSRFPLRL